MSLANKDFRSWIRSCDKEKRRDILGEFYKSLDRAGFLTKAEKNKAVIQLTSLTTVNVEKLPEDKSMWPVARHPERHAVRNSWRDDNAHPCLEEGNGNGTRSDRRRISSDDKLGLWARFRKMREARRCRSGVQNECDRTSEMGNTSSMDSDWGGSEPDVTRFGFDDRRDYHARSFNDISYRNDRRNRNYNNSCKRREPNSSNFDKRSEQKCRKFNDSRGSDENFRRSYDLGKRSEQSYRKRSEQSNRSFGDNYRTERNCGKFDHDSKTKSERKFQKFHDRFDNGKSKCAAVQDRRDCNRLKKTDRISDRDDSDSFESTPKISGNSGRNAEPVKKHLHHPVAENCSAREKTSWCNRKLDKSLYSDEGKNEKVCKIKSDYEKSSSDKLKYEGDRLDSVVLKTSRPADKQSKRTSSRDNEPLNVTAPSVIKENPNGSCSIPVGETKITCKDGERTCAAVVHGIPDGGRTFTGGGDGNPDITLQGNYKVQNKVVSSKETTSAISEHCTDSFDKLLVENIEGKTSDLSAETSSVQRLKDLVISEKVASKSSGLPEKICEPKSKRSDVKDSLKLNRLEVKACQVVLESHDLKKKNVSVKSESTDCTKNAEVPSQHELPIDISKSDDTRGRVCDVGVHSIKLESNDSNLDISVVKSEPSDLEVHISTDQLKGEDNKRIKCESRNHEVNIRMGESQVQHSKVKSEPDDDLRPDKPSPESMNENFSQNANLEKDTLNIFCKPHSASDSLHQESGFNDSHDGTVMEKGSGHVDQEFGESTPHIFPSGCDVQMEHKGPELNSDELGLKETRSVSVDRTVSSVSSIHTEPNEITLSDQNLDQDSTTSGVQQPKNVVCVEGKLKASKTNFHKVKLERVTSKPGANIHEEAKGFPDDESNQEKPKVTIERSNQKQGAVVSSDSCLEQLKSEPVNASSTLEIESHKENMKHKKQGETISEHVIVDPELVSSSVHLIKGDLTPECVDSKQTKSKLCNEKINQETFKTSACIRLNDLKSNSIDHKEVRLQSVKLDIEEAKSSSCIKRKASELLFMEANPKEARHDMNLKCKPSSTNEEYLEAGSSRDMSIPGKCQLEKGQGEPANITSNEGEKSKRGNVEDVKAKSGDTESKKLEADSTSNISEEHQVITSSTVLEKAEDISDCIRSKKCSVKLKNEDSSLSFTCSRQKNWCKTKKPKRFLKRKVGFIFAKRKPGIAWIEAAGNQKDIKDKKQEALKTTCIQPHEKTTRKFTNEKSRSTKVVFPNSGSVKALQMECLKEEQGSHISECLINKESDSQVEDQSEIKNEGVCVRESNHNVHGTVISHIDAKFAVSAVLPSATCDTKIEEASSQESEKLVDSYDRGITIGSGNSESICSNNGADPNSRSGRDEDVNKLSLQEVALSGDGQPRRKSVDDKILIERNKRKKYRAVKIPQTQCKKFCLNPIASTVDQNSVDLAIPELQNTTERLEMKLIRRYEELFGEEHGGVNDSSTFDFKKLENIPVPDSGNGSDTEKKSVESMPWVLKKIEVDISAQLRIANRMRRKNDTLSAQNDTIQKCSKVASSLDNEPRANPDSEDVTVGCSDSKNFSKEQNVCSNDKSTCRGSVDQKGTLSSNSHHADNLELLEGLYSGSDSDGTLTLYAADDAGEDVRSSENEHSRDLSMPDINKEICAEKIHSMDEVQLPSVTVLSNVSAAAVSSMVDDGLKNHPDISPDGSLSTINLERQRIPVVLSQKRSLSSVDVEHKETPEVVPQKRSLSTRVKRKSLPEIMSKEKNQPAVNTGHKNLPSIQTGKQSLQTGDSGNKFIPRILSKKHSSTTTVKSHRNLPEVLVRSYGTVGIKQNNQPEMVTSKESLNTIDRGQRNPVGISPSMPLLMAMDVQRCRSSNAAQDNDCDPVIKNVALSDPVESTSTSQELPFKITILSGDAVLNGQNQLAKQSSASNCNSSSSTGTSPVLISKQTSTPTSKPVVPTLPVLNSLLTNSRNTHDNLSSSNLITSSESVISLVHTSLCSDALFTTTATSTISTMATTTTTTTTTTSETPNSNAVSKQSVGMKSSIAADGYAGSNYISSQCTGTSYLIVSTTASVINRESEPRSKSGVEVTDLPNNGSSKFSSSSNKIEENLAHVKGNVNEKGGSLCSKYSDGDNLKEGNRVSNIPTAASTAVQSEVNAEHSSALSSKTTSLDSTDVLPVNSFTCSSSVDTPNKPDNLTVENVGEPDEISSNNSIVGAIRVRKPESLGVSSEYSKQFLEQQRPPAAVAAPAPPPAAPQSPPPPLIPLERGGSTAEHCGDIRVLGRETTAIVDRTPSKSAVLPSVELNNEFRTLLTSIPENLKAPLKLLANFMASVYKDAPLLKKKMRDTDTSLDSGACCEVAKNLGIESGVEHECTRERELNVKRNSTFQMVAIRFQMICKCFPIVHNYFKRYTFHALATVVDDNSCTAQNFEQVVLLFRELQRIYPCVFTPQNSERLVANKSGDTDGVTRPLNNSTSGPGNHSRGNSSAGQTTALGQLPTDIQITNVIQNFANREAHNTDKEHSQIIAPSLQHTRVASSSVPQHSLSGGGMNRGPPNVTVSPRLLGAPSPVPPALPLSALSRMPAKRSNRLPGPQAVRFQTSGTIYSQNVAVHASTQQQDIIRPRESSVHPLGQNTSWQQNYSHAQQPLRSHPTVLPNQSTYNQYQTSSSAVVQPQWNPSYNQSLNRHYRYNIQGAVNPSPVTSVGTYTYGGGSSQLPTTGLVNPVSDNSQHTYLGTCSEFPQNSSQYQSRPPPLYVGSTNLNYIVQGQNSTLSQRRIETNQTSHGGQNERQLPQYNISYVPNAAGFSSQQQMRGVNNQSSQGALVQGSSFNLDHLGRQGMIVSQHASGHEQRVQGSSAALFQSSLSTERINYGGGKEMHAPQNNQNNRSVPNASTFSSQQVNSSNSRRPSLEMQRPQNNQNISSVTSASAINSHQHINSSNIRRPSQQMQPSQISRVPNASVFSSHQQINGSNNRRPSQELQTPQNQNNSSVVNASAFSVQQQISYSNSRGPNQQMQPSQNSVVPNASAFNSQQQISYSNSQRPNQQMQPSQNSIVPNASPFNSQQQITCSNSRGLGQQPSQNNVGPNASVFSSHQQSNGSKDRRTSQEVQPPQKNLNSSSVSNASGSTSRQQINGSNRRRPSREMTHPENNQNISIVNNASAFNSYQQNNGSSNRRPSQEMQFPQNNQNISRVSNASAINSHQQISGSNNRRRSQEGDLASSPLYNLLHTRINASQHAKGYEQQSRQNTNSQAHASNSTLAAVDRKRSEKGRTDSDKCESLDKNTHLSNTIASVHMKNIPQTLLSLRNPQDINMSTGPSFSQEADNERRSQTFPSTTKTTSASDVTSSARQTGWLEALQKTLFPFSVKECRVSEGGQNIVLSLAEETVSENRPSVPGRRMSSSEVEQNLLAISESRQSSGSSVLVNPPVSHGQTQISSSEAQSPSVSNQVEVPNIQQNMLSSCPNMSSFSHHSLNSGRSLSTLDKEQNNGLLDSRQTIMLDKQQNILSRASRIIPTESQLSGRQSNVTEIERNIPQLISGQNNMPGVQQLVVTSPESRGYSVSKAQHNLLTASEGFTNTSGVQQNHSLHPMTRLLEMQQNLPSNVARTNLSEVQSGFSLTSGIKSSSGSGHHLLAQPSVQHASFSSPARQIISSESQKRPPLDAVKLTSSQMEQNQSPHSTSQQTGPLGAEYSLSSRPVSEQDVSGVQETLTSGSSSFSGTNLQNFPPQFAPQMNSTNIQQHLPPVSSYQRQNNSLQTQPDPSLASGGINSVTEQDKSSHFVPSMSGLLATEQNLSSSGKQPDLSTVEKSPVAWGPTNLSAEPSSSRQKDLPEMEQSIPLPCLSTQSSSTGYEEMGISATLESSATQVPSSNSVQDVASASASSARLAEDTPQSAVLQSAIQENSSEVSNRMGQQQAPFEENLPSSVDLERNTLSPDVRVLLSPEVAVLDPEENWPDVELLYEVVGPSRTVSRDSGYTTPSPVVVGGDMDQNQNDVDGDAEIPCAVCNRRAEVICSGCRRRCYCTEMCQLSHWNLVHHLECTVQQDA